VLVAQKHLMRPRPELADPMPPAPVPGEPPKAGRGRPLSRRSSGHGQVVGFVLVLGDTWGAKQIRGRHSVRSRERVVGFIENTRERDNLPRLSVLHYIEVLQSTIRLLDCLAYTCGILSLHLAYTCGIISLHLNNRRVYHII
jgi:hypothetical protein